MNEIERVLNDEVNRLIDRLATSMPGGGPSALGSRGATLRNRLDEAEQQLAAARAAMLDSYGRWRRGLEDVENLWALAAWRSAAEETAEPAATLAA